MSVKSQQVTKNATAKQAQAAPAVMTRVRGFAGNHTMGTRAGSGGWIPINSYATARIQPKLTVNAPGDRYEQEADRVAERVMRMPEPTLRRACACGGGCPRCKNEEQRVQRRPLAPTSCIQEKEDAGDVASDAISNRIAATQGSGSALPEGPRNFMESRFAADFSNVRIHSGASAVEMSQEMNAQAFTVGTDIYFNAGKYAPDSTNGRQLLAHELTHIMQQQTVEHLKAGAGVVQAQPNPNTTGQHVNFFGKDFWQWLKKAGEDEKIKSKVATELALAYVNRPGGGGIRGRLIRTPSGETVIVSSYVESYNEVYFAIKNQIVPTENGKGQNGSDWNWKASTIGTRSRTPSEKAEVAIEKVSEEIVLEMIKDAIIVSIDAYALEGGISLAIGVSVLNPAVAGFFVGLVFTSLLAYAAIEVLESWSESVEEDLTPSQLIVKNVKAWLEAEEFKKNIINYPLPTVIPMPKDPTGGAGTGIQYNAR